jgi:OmpA-OmpF porin, OOP family
MRRDYFIFAVLFVCINAFGQNADTLIYAEGKIINASTKELVNATISYQSLPYGNIVGILNGNTYRFPLFDKEKYAITVEAIGFATAKYMLDPVEANNERIIIKDIELGLPSSASAVVESVHTPGKVMRLDHLIFELGRSKINPESYSELNEIVVMIQNYPDMIIQLEGHTDFKGDPKQNMKLSQDRVDAVKTYLLSKGVSKSKVKTKAFGGTAPLSREDTEAAHQMNRRVEVRILEN